MTSTRKTTPMEIEFDEEVGRFSQLRGFLDEYVPAEENRLRPAKWLTGAVDADGVWAESVDPYEMLDEVRQVLQDMINSTHRLEMFLHTRDVLLSH